VTISLRDIPEALKVLREEWERQSAIPGYIRSWHGKARLQVVKRFLDSVSGWVDSLHAADEEIATDDTESWGWQLTSAADLLGVEVQS
jgi:hypothetical protein